MSNGEKYRPPQLPTKRFVNEEIARLKLWVADLQSGMYVNCVYCGHRYGPEKNVPISMAQILKEHIEKCPDHPMSHLKTRNAVLTKILEAALHCVRSYQYGNAAPALAEEMGDAIEEVLTPSAS
jgi:hypothetical protein